MTKIETQPIDQRMRRPVPHSQLNRILPAANMDTFFVARRPTPGKGLVCFDSLTSDLTEAPVAYRAGPRVVENRARHRGAGLNREGFSRGIKHGVQPSHRSRGAPIARRFSSAVPGRIGDTRRAVGSTTKSRKKCCTSVPEHQGAAREARPELRLAKPKPEAATLRPVGTERERCRRPSPPTSGRERTTC